MFHSGGIERATAREELFDLTFGQPRASYGIALIDARNS
jgi:hypothetical protein